MSAQRSGLLGLFTRHCECMFLQLGMSCMFGSYQGLLSLRAGKIHCDVLF